MDVAGFIESLGPAGQALLATGLQLLLIAIATVIALRRPLLGRFAAAFGANLDLFVLDLSLSCGSAGYGRYPGEQPVSDFTVEVSFRID